MWRWLLGGLVVLLLVSILALSRFPAYQAYTWIAEDAPALRAAGFDGTLWRGTAEEISLSGYLLGHAQWRLHPLSLLAASPRSDWVIEGPEVQASVTLTSDGLGLPIKLSGLKATAPAAWMQVILQEPFLQLQGTLGLDFSELRLGSDGRLRALTGLCRWEDAAVSGTLRTALGALWLDFTTTADGVMIGTLGDDGGPLGLEGTVTLVEDQYRVDAWLTARADDEVLIQALNVLGRPDSMGRMRLRIEGPMLTLETVLQ